MKYYIYTKKCRRKFILNYFNEKYDLQNCEMCDICLNISNSETEDINNKINKYCKYKFKKGLIKDLICNKPIINNNNYCNQHNKN